jgi:hypothetical protein
MFDWKLIQDGNGERLTVLNTWVEKFKSLLRHGASPYSTCNRNHVLYRSDDSK